jgi:hypothetical protein
MTLQEYEDINNSNLFANLESNIFGAKLARYYTDNDNNNNVNEIEA